MNRMASCRQKFNIQRARSLGALAAVLGATVLAASAQEQNKAVPSERDELIQKSSYVFTGTVRAVGTSNVKLVPGGDNTAVVRIDHVAKGADTVGDFTGDDVTVVLQKPKSVAVGDKFHFYTNLKVSGAYLAVDELGHTPIVAGEETGVLKTRAAQLKTEAATKKIEAHTTDADLIVTGKVTATKALPPDDRPARRSEHDPEWWEATIAVESTEKGQAAADKVLTVYYPFSRDIRWFRVPKLSVGEEGVFFLHSKMHPGAPAKGEEHEADASDIKGYKILHVDDVQPMTARDQIRTMLRNAK
jgi:hypothetical protein